MLLRQPVQIRLEGLRLAGLVMLPLAAVWPLLPQTELLACPLRRITGVPCPMCGMTTSVVATMHGDLAGALDVNPFGILAVAVAGALMLWRKPKPLPLPVGLIVAGILASWLFQLTRFGWI